MKVRIKLPETMVFSTVDEEIEADAVELDTEILELELDYFSFEGQLDDGRVVAITQPLVIPLDDVTLLKKESD